MRTEWVCKGNVNTEVVSWQGLVTAEWTHSCMKNTNERISESLWTMELSNVVFPGTFDMPSCVAEDEILGCFTRDLVHPVLEHWD